MLPLIGRLWQVLRVSAILTIIMICVHDEMMLTPSSPFHSSPPSSRPRSMNIMISPATFLTRRSQRTVSLMATSLITPFTPLQPLRRSSLPSNGLNSLCRALTVSEAVYSFRLLEALRNGDAATILPFLEKEATRAGPVRELTSPLHLAVRCAECKCNASCFVCVPHSKAVLFLPFKLPLFT